MKTMKVIMAIAMVFTIALTGCKKDAGPKGDKGDKGDAGINGTNGSNGTNGTNGVANIMSYTLNSTPGGWTHIGTNGQAGDGFKVIFSVPALTGNIIADGAVLMYIISGSTIGQMPLTFSAYQNVSSTLSYDASPGIIAITISDSDFNTVAPSGNISFKLVTIPPAFIIAHPNYKDMSYDELIKYNLQD